MDEPKTVYQIEEIKQKNRSDVNIGIVKKLKIRELSAISNGFDFKFYNNNFKIVICLV